MVDIPTPSDPVKTAAPEASDGAETAPSASTKDQHRPRLGMATGMSRRGFLTGAAGAAAVAGLASPGAQSKTVAPSAASVLGPGAVPLRFELNGTAIATSAEPRETLADVLLFRLDLTGTKLGCDRGSCGACTVWVDGHPRASCMTPALDIAERKVTTIEGLIREDRVHSLQEAFVKRDAMQCGYCIPGFVMSAAALLARVESPTEEQVREALSGNLCRCGSHPHIVSAVLDAARGDSGEEGPR